MHLVSDGHIADEPRRGNVSSRPRIPTHHDQERVARHGLDLAGSAQPRLAGAPSTGTIQEIHSSDRPGLPGRRGVVDVGPARAVTGPHGRVGELRLVGEPRVAGPRTLVAARARRVARSCGRQVRAVVDRTRGFASDAGMATAEYAIVTLAAVGFAGLLVVILKGGEVKGLLSGIVRQALSS